MTFRFVGHACLALFFASVCASVLAQGRTVRDKTNKFQVVETSISETQAAIRTGKVTCHQLVQTYLDRIAAYDQSTRLNTVVTLNPKAMEL
jgi:hypothetical protein